jgi:YegS/Rv2252/BmrU family lipid kinase
VSRPVCVIVNPAAGGGRAGRVAAEVTETLRGHGLEVRCVDAEGIEHARELARGAAHAGETVAVLGGDGLIGIVAHALRDVPGAVLGVLPAGRGNDLARVLGLPRDPFAACSTIAGGIAREMDLGEVLGEHAGTQGPGAVKTFVGIASAGFDSDANRIANEASPRLGRLVYAYGALRALVSWRAARFEIELDPPGPRHAFVGYSVAAANSQAYGGGMLLAPDALLDDGLLDVVVIEHVSKLRLLVNLPKVFRGAHMDLPWVHVFRAADVEISADRPFTLYADGDPIAELPVRVRAARSGVRVLVQARPQSRGRGRAAFGADRTPSFALTPPPAPAPAEPAANAPVLGDVQPPA